MGLAYDCPFGERLADCALNELMSLPFRERVAKIKTWNTDKQASVLFRHYDCFGKR